MPRWWRSRPRSRPGGCCPAWLDEGGVGERGRASSASCRSQKGLKEAGPQVPANGKAGKKPVQPVLGSAPRTACGTSVPSVKARGSTGTQRHVCERPQGSACICSWEPQLKRRRAEIGSLSHCSAGPSSLGAGARLGASGRLVGCACTSAECRHRVSRSTHLHELRITR